MRILSYLTFRLCFLFVDFWPTRESFGMARGPRFWAQGVDSGPRGGAFEGILDPQPIITNIYLYWCPNGAYVVVMSAAVRTDRPNLCPWSVHSKSKPTRSGRGPGLGVSGGLLIERQGSRACIGWLLASKGFAGSGAKAAPSNTKNKKLVPYPRSGPGPVLNGLRS